MTKHLIRILALFLMITLLMSCDQKSMSRGTVRNIVVVADSVLWTQVQDIVKEKLSPERLTPQPEYIFALKQIPPQNFSRLKRYPQILFIGTLDMQDETKNLIDQMLPEGSKARNLIDSGERFFYQVDEPWSENQLLGVLVSKDVTTLIENVKNDGQQIFDVFNAFADMRSTKQVYYREFQKQPTKELMEKFNWSVDVPLSWVVALEDSVDRFVWIRRMNPQRELFVYWEEVDDPSILSKEWMIETRNRLTQAHYEGDIVYTDSMVTVLDTTVNFLDRYAIKIEGIWQNYNLNIGGPFRTFGFYNQDDGRLYLVDLSVFAPEERKWPFLRHLEAVAKTFKTQSELKK